MWLIEINTNPCLEESSNLLKTLLPRMIDDALRLTIDVAFVKKRKQKESKGPAGRDKPDRSRFPFKGYSSEENMWEYVC